MPEPSLDSAELIYTPSPQSLPDSGWGGALVVVGAGVAGFLAQWGAVLLWFPPARQTTVWLLGGTMMAIALLTEPRRWVAVLPAAGAGQALLFISLGLTPVRSAIALGFLSTLATITPAVVLRRVTGRPFTFGTFREFTIYFGVVVVGGSLFASALYMLGAQGFGYRPVTLLVWRTFVLSAALGYLMVTPMLVLLRQEADAIRHDATGRRIEAGLLGTLLLLGSSFVFQDLPHRTTSWPLFAILIPPLLLWAAMRFAALGASASVLLVTVLSTFGAARGLGPFTTQSPGENTLTLQLFMLATGLPLIGLSVVLAEHSRTMFALRTTHGRLREIHGDLLVAREEEATRIARELHDDVGQRLALVSIGLSRLRRSFPDPESVPAGDIGRLQEQTSSIARSLRELSHDLHPAALEHVGLAASLQMKCDEVAAMSGLEVHLACEGETSDLPNNVALCLFRVTQEALTNVVRHAEAVRVTLVLQRGAGAISLRISDDGRGFHPGKPEGRAGLGLHSAAERLRALGGTLAIDSAKGAGTRLHVNVPLDVEVHA